MKGKKGHKAKWFILAAILLSACSGDGTSDITDPTPSGNKTEIKVNADVGRMMEGTRATTINSNTDLRSQDIRIDAYFNGTETECFSNAKLHYSSGWKFWSSDPGSETHYFWPIDGSQYSSGSDYTSLDFVGYCPYTMPSYVTTSYNHSCGINFTCDMSDYMTSDEQSGKTEFMCAIASNRTAAGGTVPLTFKHPFAYIKFVVGGSDADITIKSISFSEMKTSGTCVFNGTTSTWSSQSGSATLSITENLQYGSAKTETTPFLVIPNNYGDKILTVKVSWTDWGEQIDHYLTTTVDLDWEAGYSYTYTLNVTKTDLIVDTTKFTEQW
jgi:hypothetical protein